MEKSKLELLLENVGELKIFVDAMGNTTAHSIIGKLLNSYHAYMEERKTIPQEGDEIEVRDDENEDWVIRRFIGFHTDGSIVVQYESGGISVWSNYRIPTPKKKMKVVLEEPSGLPLMMPADHQTEFELITTFEY